MKGKKKLAKLMPIKKTVMDKRSNQAIDRTYYVDPNKDIKVDGKRKKGDKPPEEGKKSKDGKNAKDSKGKDKNDKDKRSIKLEPKKDMDNNLKDVKDFEDFGKHDVDPEAAKTFFCRM